LWFVVGGVSGGGGGVVGGLWGVGGGGEPVNLYLIASLLQQGESVLQY